MSWIFVNRLGVFMLFGLLFVAAYQWQNSHSASPTTKNTQTTIQDATGTTFTCGAFQKIASASPVADRILPELVHLDRVVAVSRFSLREADYAFIYVDKIAIEHLGNIEHLLSIPFDLLLINSNGDTRRVQQLRDAGLQVFDLGEVRGLQSYFRSVKELGCLVQEQERAQRHQHALSRRLNRVASDISVKQTGLYLSLFGERLYGGTIGSSAHELLHYSGLIDVAAEHYRDWPNYDREQVLALDPEVIVTDTRSEQALCAVPGFAQLRACQSPQNIIGLPAALLSDPGPSLLEAAEIVRDRVYGPPTNNNDEHVNTATTSQSP